jgi:hypothetical protein
MQTRPTTPADVPAVLPMVARTYACTKLGMGLSMAFLPNLAEHYRRRLVQQTTSDRSIFLLAERETSKHAAAERDQTRE